MRMREGLERSSSFFRNRSNAICLFLNWLRSSWLVTTIPVGRWRILTAVSRRLTCCPPGPLARNVSTSHSARSAWSDSGMQ